MDLKLPMSSTKHSEPRGKFFNFPNTTKAKAVNTSEIVSAMANEANFTANRDFKNMSGPIQLDKSTSGWQNNFSGLSQNSSSSRVVAKEKAKRKYKKAERQTEDANREIMKKITSDNKYFAILKKITQESGRHNSYTNPIGKQFQSKVKEEEKDYEVIDSSGGTQDNLFRPNVAKNKRMYGTEKLNMKKYNNILSQNQIMIDDEMEEGSESELFSEPKIEFPLQPGKALKLFMDKLTDYEKSEILDYKSIYFLGENSKKILGSLKNDFNYGYDDERGDYNVKMGDHIAYRFEIIDFLGKGSFGQALKWFDHKRKSYIALKIIRNKKKFQYQASVEVKILRHLRECDPNDENNIIRLKDSFIFRKHICITFELLSINLYEFIKSNDFQGVSLGLIRRFAIQILQGLRYTKQQKIIHCDLKPENILLKNINKSGIKIIDFGSGWFESERVYTYIQSRFYRAPEIILGIPYTASIDMWSWGCILAELFWGYPIFAGESEMDQLGLIMEIWGIPEDYILEQATRKSLFFDESNKPSLKPNSRGKLRRPNTKSLTSVLRWSENSFIRFLSEWFIWDPEERMTPDEALMHNWILEGLPPKVLAQHKKILGIADDTSSKSSKMKSTLRNSTTNRSSNKTDDFSKTSRVQSLIM
jgi:dual specificity tyrosine-phosphorylation-regulated kinase 2/3/4